MMSKKTKKQYNNYITFICYDIIYYKNTTKTFTSNLFSLKFGGNGNFAAMCSSWKLAI